MNTSNNNLPYFIAEAKILTDAIAKIEKLDKSLYVKECAIVKRIQHLQQELAKLISIQTI